MQAVSAEIQTGTEAFPRLYALPVSLALFICWLTLCTFGMEACGPKRQLHISLHFSLKWFSRNICDNFCFLTSPQIINSESVALPGNQNLYFGIFLGFLFYHSENHYVVEMKITNKIKFAYGWLWLALCACYAWLIIVPLGRVPSSGTNC